MTKADGHLLETLSESELQLSPRILAVNADYSRHYVSRRLAKLREAELVEKVDDGLYRITEKGTAYLNGELDADDLSIGDG